MYISVYPRYTQKQNVGNPWPKHNLQVHTNEREALPGVAYPGVRDNRSTINTKTGYDDDDDVHLKTVKKSFKYCSKNKNDRSLCTHLHNTYIYLHSGETDGIIKSRRGTKLGQTSSITKFTIPSMVGIVNCTPAIDEKV